MSRRILAVCMILAMVVSFAGMVSAGEMKTITGTLVSEDQLQADDGQQYMIEDTGAAQNLDQLVNKKVEIKGAVEEKEGQKVLRIESINAVE